MSAADPKRVSSSEPKKKQRVELAAPPHPAISWVILVLYAIVAIEGATLVARYPWQTAFSIQNFYAGDDIFTATKSAQTHLCGIYVLESLLALGPGWCAMSPGWTLFDLLIHHVPYVCAVSIAFSGAHAERWTAPMAVVMLTPANEGMFIAAQLGAPDGLQKFRRLFGFTGVSLLWFCETLTLFRNLAIHYSVGRPAIISALLDQIAWGGIYYHALLLHLYIRRWKKTRTL